ncbi:hypothetical protein AAFF_G00265090 [Aldrovandia affinis]|uniref:C2H2-type domain-containing protein n=1 Tax=Aldrovandia affinis TaxID=143900 RepID=A0AAD7RBL3_9TELE|nr:hypothetical protein AAFF_G00265090 [Aldrovandia affinis]
MTSLVRLAWFLLQQMRPPPRLPSPLLQLLRPPPLSALPGAGALCSAPSPPPPPGPRCSSPPPRRPPGPPAPLRSAGCSSSSGSTMTGMIAAASFFSNCCRFGTCGLRFDSLAELIGHIEESHIDTDPRMLEKQELQQPTYVALSYINRFMTDAARREQKKVQPKLSLSLMGGVARTSVATPPRHSSGSLTPPVTPPITPPPHSAAAHPPQYLCRVSLAPPAGSEYDEEEAEFEESDSDESWTTESAISSESILSAMSMSGGDEKPFACPVPGCRKRYKNVNGIKYHAKNGHRTQIRVRKAFKCRCGKSYKTPAGLRHHTVTFHPPGAADIARKTQP